MKKRGKKIGFSMIVISLLYIVLLLNFVEGVNTVEIPNPEIYVSFSGEEVVNVISFGLYNSTGGSFLVSEVIEDRVYNPQTMLHFFHFKPGVLDNPNDFRNFLRNGFYTFIINATDATGNIRYNQRQDFIIEVPTLEIKIKSPRHEISSQQNFLVSIETARARNVSNSSTCRYNFNADRTWANMVYTFSPLDSPVNSNHITKENITQIAKMYVRCKDIYENTYLKTFNLEVDTTPPIIEEVYSDPNPIVEEIDSNIQSDIYVLTNEASICKFDNISVPYNQMFNNFTGYDPYDTDAYKNMNTHRIKFLSDGTTYYKYISCENKAGLISEMATLQFSTNLDAALTAAVVSPSPSTGSVGSTNYIKLEVNTNKHSYCEFTSGGNITESIQGDSHYSKTHERDIPLNKEGTYSYDVTCNYYEQEASANFDYTFDVTKPTMLFVNDTDPHLYEFPDRTYHTTSLYARWSGEDKISEIDYYEVSIREFSGSCTGELIMNWTHVNDDEERFTADEFLNNQILINNHKYCFIVRAVDEAGHVSSELSSDGILIDTSHRPKETIPPNTWLNISGFSGYADLSIGCFDFGSDTVECDNSSFKYGLSLINSSCEPTRVFDKTVRINESTHFCWRVADSVGNTRSGFEKIEITPLGACEDGVLGPDETDFDCGGNCAGCNNGKLCLENSDCKSSFCFQGFCESPKCDDNVKNQDETDVDCGGQVCDACEIGSICNKNSDCLSYSCYLDTCVLGNCSDSIQNQGESDIDCGGFNCQKCEISDTCKSSDDCITGYCSDFNKCENKPNQVTTTTMVGSSTEESTNMWYWIIPLILLLIGGGVGAYFYIKKSKTSVTAPAPVLSIPMTTRRPMKRRPKIDYKQLLLERKRRKMMERAKKLAEEKKQKKSKKRKGLFMEFGAENEEADEESNDEPKVVSKIPFSKEKMTKKYSVFDKLEGVIPKKKSSVDKLGNLSGKSFKELSEIVDKPKKDIYNELSKLSKKKKTKGTFSKLADVLKGDEDIDTLKKDKDIFDKLPKKIRKKK